MPDNDQKLKVYLETSFVNYLTGCFVDLELQALGKPSHIAEDAINRYG